MEQANVVGNGNQVSSLQSQVRQFLTPSIKSSAFLEEYVNEVFRFCLSLKLRGLESLLLNPRRAVSLDTKPASRLLCMEAQPLNLLTGWFSLFEGNYLPRPK